MKRKELFSAAVHVSAFADLTPAAKEVIDSLIALAREQECIIRQVNNTQHETLEVLYNRYLAAGKEDRRKEDQPFDGPDRRQRPDDVKEKYNLLYEAVEEIHHEVTEYIHRDDNVRDDSCDYNCDECTIHRQTIKESD